MKRTTLFAAGVVALLERRAGHREGDPVDARLLVRGDPEAAHAARVETTALP